MRMNLTPEEKQRCLKDLSVIYYRCRAGKATEHEVKIAEKFSPYFIERLEEKYSEELEMVETDAEKKEIGLMWERIAAGLHLADKETGKEEHGRKRTLFVGHHWRKWQNRAAAVILVLLLTGAALFFYTNAAGNGGRETSYVAEEGLNSCMLKDGTFVEMNRESKLYIAKAFDDSRREVSMDGQIFFHVAKNPKKPFIITAQGFNVTVKGTSFEVMSYKEVEDKQVTVSTGRVEVSDVKDGKLLAVLTPGMQLIYNPRTKYYEVKKVNSEDITAWRKGKLVLNSASVAELRLRLRQSFGKLLVIEDNAMHEDARITSTFNYEDVTIDNVMNRICALFGAKYKIESNRIIISASNI